MAKRYLDVSYDDRELAKRLGAKWDPSVRRWYCPAGSPLAKIFQWRAEAQKTAAQKAETQKADSQKTGVETKTDQNSPRAASMTSDIHFKTTDMMAAGKPQVQAQSASQPAINQNFELFMAS